LAECDKITKTIVRNLIDYSRSPEMLRKARERLCGVIDL
jgi:hypothetical protein